MLRDVTLIFSLVLLTLNMGTHLWVRFRLSLRVKRSNPTDEITTSPLAPRNDTWHRIFWLNAVLIFLFLAAVTYLQYKGWGGSPLTAYLLPPTTLITYFIQYVFFKIWISHGISLGIALLAVFGLHKLNRRKEGALLHDGEHWLAGSSMFLSGFPGVIIFLPVFLVLFLLTVFVQTIRKGKEHRVSPLFLWFPTALCVILLIYLFLQDTSWWLLLRP